MPPIRPSSHMETALAAARAAADRNEVPVGAVLVRSDGAVLAVDGNRTNELNDVSAHAEVLVIRAAGRLLQSPRLSGCDLYVTLEPCAMCADAISFARIRRLYFGSDDPKMGAVLNGGRFFDQPTCHHRPDVYDGFSADASTELLRTFFDKRR